MGVRAVENTAFFLWLSTITKIIGYNITINRKECMNTHTTIL